jgi:hypothetical protein
MPYTNLEKMTNYCFALPYLQGGTELARKFAEENCGHTKDHDDFINSPEFLVNKFGFSTAHQATVLLILE